ncbi:MAG: hypothetical protein R3B54_14160 [Bdellovibrionota bacterium]
MKHVFGSATVLAFTLVTQVFAMAPPPPPISATASVPEIPTNLIPWIVGGSAGLLFWVRSYFKK